jgi:hypothetical protein
MAVAALVAEVTKARDAIAEKDEALFRASSERDAIIERANTLQLMLGADKVIGVFSRAVWGSALAALCHWRHVVAGLDSEDDRNTELIAHLRTADELTAETSARLEAEEARRKEAERLAFEEGRRRRRAEEARAAAEAEAREARAAAEARLDEVRAAAEAEVQRAHAAAEAQKQQTHATVDEQLQQASAQVASKLERMHEVVCDTFSVALAARREQRALTHLLGTWRLFAATARHRAARLQAAAEMAAERTQSEANARSAAEAIAAQLRVAQREASEAQLLVLAARQQRAEALAKAAAEEEQRLESVVLGERRVARHSQVLEQLGAVFAAAAAQLCLGASLRFWAVLATARRVAAAQRRLGRCLGATLRFWAVLATARRVRAKMAGSAAAAESELRGRLEAAVREAAAHAGALAEARAESAHADAAASERQRALSARASIERLRTSVEGRGLLCGEIDYLERAFTRSEHARYAGADSFAEREWRLRQQADLQASLSHWSHLVSRRRHHALSADLDRARQAAADASAGLVRRAAVASRARTHWAHAVAYGDARLTAATSFGAWRHVAVAARREAAAAAEASQREALQQQLSELTRLAERLSAELQQSQATLSARTEELEAARVTADARADASECRVAELEHAATQAALAASKETLELRMRLGAAEQQAALEAARARRAEEVSSRLEEDVRAAELRALWNKEQAAQQASLIHEQLHETIDLLAPSPRRAPTRRAHMDAADE